MNIIESISLFVIMVSLALMPSTSVVLVVTRSITLGLSNGIAVAIGIVLGDLFFILLVLLGLTVVAEMMGSLFIIVKYLGAFYLLWFGYGLLLNKEKTTIKLTKSNDKSSLAASFLAGFFLTLGDIKAIFFYLSLFPMFVNLSALQVNDIILIVLITVFAVGGAKVFYAFSARKIASMAKGFKHENLAKKTLGGFLLGVGSYIMIKA